MLLRSRDRGYSWQAISEDLTHAIDRSKLKIMGVGEEKMLSRHDGISPWGNITTISESPLDADLLYVGTDDGRLQVRRDGGRSWKDFTSAVPGLPEHTYVSRVAASQHEEGLVYATFDGHRNDDYRPYVYRSRDHGESWESIGEGLPEWSVNVILEHPRTADLLFLGNEIGVYFSLNGGGRWERLESNLPTVPVDDMIVHPRENDLVIGTHGRSIWILQDITPLEQLQGSREGDVHLFPVRAARLFNIYSPQEWVGEGRYAASNTPYGARIRYAVNRAQEADEGENPKPIRFQIRDAEGNLLRELEGRGEEGIQEVVWDLRLEPPYRSEEEERGFAGRPRGPRVLPGTYSHRQLHGPADEGSATAARAGGREVTSVGRAGQPGHHREHAPAEPTPRPPRHPASRGRAHPGAA